MSETDPSSARFDRAYYEHQYPNYWRQNPPYKLAFYKELVELAGAQHPRPRILDIGCAFGLFLSCLGPRWERFGIDASEYAIDEAKARVPGARFAVAGPGEFPFHQHFDVITAFDVLEHIRDLDAILRLFSESLAPGGGVVFVVPVYDGPTGPIIRALDKDSTHVHKKSRYFWLEWVSRSFAIRNWWGIYRYLLPGGFYLHLVTRRFRGCTPAIACLAQWRKT